MISDFQGQKMCMSTKCDKQQPLCADASSAISKCSIMSCKTAHEL